MGRGRIRIEDEYSSSDSESRYGDPIRIEKRKDVWRATSKDRRREHRHAAEQQPVIINNRLAIPIESGGRHRANSTSGQPAPVVFIPQLERSPSRSRSRHHHHHHYTSSSSSSRSGSRSRRKRSGLTESDLPYDLKKKLDRANDLEERERRERAREDEDRKAKDARNRYERDLEEQTRKDKDKRDRYLQEYEEKQRKEEDRRHAIILEQEEKEKEAKRKREELARQLKEEEIKKKRDREELEHRILLEAEEKKKIKELEEKELKARILREAKEEEEKEKAKKRLADEEFELRVRAQALKAGWSEDYVEDLLGKEKEERRHRHHGHRAFSPASVGRREHEMLLEYQRPTWIRIDRRHILPETLDYYRLKWDYDEDDRDFIMIKEYVDHDLQRELFEHTKTIMRSRKLITPGYTKETETITTLRPREVVKKKGDKMFVVRSKSKSPAPRRLSFIG